MCKSATGWPWCKEGGLRVLLTGATGLIGGAVVAGLYRRRARGGGGRPRRRAAARLPAAATGSRSTSPPPARPTGCRISPTSMRSSTAPACCRTTRGIRRRGACRRRRRAVRGLRAGRRAPGRAGLGDRGRPRRRDHLLAHQARRRRGADGARSRLGDPAPSVVLGRRPTAAARCSAASPRCPSCRASRTPDRCRSCSSTTSCARSLFFLGARRADALALDLAGPERAVARRGRRRLSPLARPATPASSRVPGWLAPLLSRWATSSAGSAGGRRCAPPRGAS